MAGWPVLSRLACGPRLIIGKLNTAVIAARQQIVEGAVGMVDMALDLLAAETADAYLALAALVGDGLAWPRRLTSRSGLP